MSEYISTKEEERQVLVKIRKLLGTLESNSYLNTAFKGICEVAEDNINNDFANSPYDRVLFLEDELDKSRSFTNQLKKSNDELTAIANKQGAEIQKLKDQCIADGEDHMVLARDYQDEMYKRQEIEIKLEAAEQEIMKLKAKLYDLLCK